MSKATAANITRRDFTATMSAIAGAAVVSGAAASAAPASLAEDIASEAWAAYTLAELDYMHEALTKADDGVMAVYNQPRVDIEGPAGAFLFDHMESVRRTANGIVEAARVRKAETRAELDTQWRILARAAAGLDNRDMERELVALILARHQLG